MKKGLLIFLTLGASLLHAQVSPFTGLQPVNDSSGNFSFIVSGHFHGSSSNISGFPASSLLANINRINNSGASFIVSTGDLFLDIKTNIPDYKNSLFTQLRLPLYNVPGNHDYPAAVYEKEFGKTFSYFYFQNNGFLLLDTEMDNGSISGDQLLLLKDFVGKSVAARTIKNLFIFSHRPVWAEDDEVLKEVFIENTASAFETNFEKEIEPFLNTYAKKIPIYWFSGSLGASAPASFFYHKTPAGIMYIQSAIRDLPRDAMLQVEVKNGNVGFTTFSLNQHKAPLLTECTLEMWKRAPKGESFNYRLTKLYLIQMSTHRYFWYGVLWTAALVICMVVFIKWRRRKKSGR